MENMENHNKRADDQIGIMRGLLKSEITWVFFIVAAIMGFVSSVVLPIQKLQIQITQIQVDLGKESSTYASFNERLRYLELQESKKESISNPIK
jgi:hypothetical protein